MTYKTKVYVDEQRNKAEAILSAIGKSEAFKCLMDAVKYDKNPVSKISCSLGYTPQIEKPEIVISPDGEIYRRVESTISKSNPHTRKIIEKQFKKGNFEKVPNEGWTLTYD